MSSLSRAFTTKRAIKPADISTPMPKRSLTTKGSGSIRDKISAPVELISTTNMLSYNAPDIYPKSSKSISSISTRSSNSADDSDRSPTSVSTPLTSPDRSSLESSPTSIEPNHLSCYFGAPSRQSASGEDAPMIPQRAVSHTKKTAEALARKRSSSRMSSPKNSISRISASKSGMAQARSSINMFAANVETIEQHPFGNELAQVSEIAEEYGISQERLSIVDEEERELRALGLFKFCAEEYMSEIHGLFLSAFGEVKPKMSTMWI